MNYRSQRGPTPSHRGRQRQIISKIRGRIQSFIEENEYRANNKKIYIELIYFLNNKFEDEIIQFYEDENELGKLRNDKKFIGFDEFYKRETGISLLEKYGFLKALKKT